MRAMSRRVSITNLSLAAATAIFAGTLAHAQVDTLQTVVNSTNAVGGVTNPPAQPSGAHGRTTVLSVLACTR